MSEYQYYEFPAIDHPLDERQRAELRALSTRARITATSFVNEYHWGGFRGNPDALMERYFDAFLYLANWGTRRLMIRLPRGLLDLGVAERYCTGDAASAWAADGHVILSLSSEDGDEYWEEGEGRLASIALVRSELAAGDLRLLYLAWLLSVQAEEQAWQHVDWLISSKKTARIRRGNRRPAGPAGTCRTRRRRVQPAIPATS